MVITKLQFLKEKTDSLSLLLRHLSGMELEKKILISEFETETPLQSGYFVPPFPNYKYFRQSKRCLLGGGVSLYRAQKQMIFNICDKYAMKQRIKQ